MKAQSSGKSKMEMGFNIPAVGTYLWTVGDDVQVYMKDEVRNGEEAGPKSLMVPLTISGVIEGDAKEGEKHNWFINLVKGTGEINGIGEKHLGEFMDVLGIMDDLVEKTGGKDFDPTTSTAFHQFLAVNMPNKVFKGKHTTRINKKTGQEDFQWETLESANGAAAPATNEVEGDWS